MVQYPKSYFQDSKFRAAKEKIQASRTALKTKVKAESTADDALKTKQVNDVQRADKTADAEHDSSMAQGLDYADWLPFAAKTYHVSPRIEDYILVKTVVCPSDLPNRNGIAFPAVELAKFLPPPMNRQVYKAWKGCPIHTEHDNEDHTKAHGIILDTFMTRVTGFGGGKLWKVMGLLAIDKNKYPDRAMQVLTKEVNTYSMGAMVEMFRCGYCGTECYHDPETERHIGCHHISSIKNVNWGVERSYDGQEHLSFLNAYGISPIECSIVDDPAWAPALSDEVWEHTPTEPSVRNLVKTGQPKAPRTPGENYPGESGPSPQFIKDLYKLKW